MLKLKLDPTFEAEVSVTVPGQLEPGTLPLVFKYRTRKEFGEWLDSLQEIKEDDEKDEDGNIIKEGKVIRAGKTALEAFPEYVESWGLSEGFTKKNIEIFLDNYSSAHIEIIGQYSKLLFGSRIKN